MTKQETGSFLDRMNDVCRESQKQLNADVMAGVGNIYERLEDSTFSYKEALDTLNHNHLLNEKESLTIYAKNIRKEKRTYSVLTKEKGQLLENAIRFGNRESVTKCIKELFEVIVEQNFSMNQYQLYYFGIVTTLMHVMADHVVEMNAAVEESIVYIDDLGNHSLRETQESVERLSHKLSDSIQMEYIDSSKAIICKAKRFIEAEFADSDLSVEKISKKLYISSTYFSTLFKKETSKSFITYLTDIRLEQALRLLETTENKSCQIAEKVGYPEANYFSYVFKKKFGMSPTSYRKQLNTQLV
ncbi:MAG: AraC family transcriptional regulator [Pisciglobus halotolerans]|nr:AraC family transcriptional regulator [Pisciglobus halotolerans]